MKGNIRRVLAASGILVAVLMLAVSAFGSAAYAAGPGQNGKGDDFTKCVKGQIVLFDRVDTGQKDKNGQPIFKNVRQGVVGTCPDTSIPNNTNYRSWTNEQIQNYLMKSRGLTRAQLDVIISAYFGQKTIPSSFNLQAWFANYMGQNNTGTKSSNNNNNNNNNNSTQASMTGTNQSGSTTGTNQSGSKSGSTTGTGQSGNTGANTSSNGGVGGAGAPATLPTTGGGLSTVSPLVLALGALLVLFGMGVYKFSATR